MSLHTLPPISDKFLYTNPQEAEILAAALAGRQLSGTSALVTLYEEALANYFGTKYPRVAQRANLK